MSMPEGSPVPREMHTGAGTQPSGRNGDEPRAGSGEMDAQRALSERPVISIRARISLAFLLCFVLICGITITGMVFISSLTGRQLLGAVKRAARPVYRRIERL
jgi:hypothetical protein